MPHSPRHCGIWAIDIPSGTVAGYLRLKGSVAELYEVAILPGKRFPARPPEHSAA
jgi:hypothetical protein